MSILDIKTEEELDIAIVTNKGEEKLVVDFYKEGCAPCMMLSNIVGSLESKFEGAHIKFVKVKLEDVGEDLFKKLNIQGTPTLRMYQEGKIVGNALTGRLTAKDVSEFLGIR